MNEQIKEIAEKSYIYDKQNDSSFFDKEKFAELIVRECFELVRFNSNGAGQEILEHFGVTE
jgi:hypothetical protein